MDPEQIFLIRSRGGDPFATRWCLSSPRSSQARASRIAELWHCNVDDPRQHFYWLTRTIIVNIATGFCLSLSSAPPSHGDQLSLQPCQRSLATTRQSWIGSADYFLSGWLPESRDVETRSYQFKLEQHPITRDVS